MNRDYYKGKNKAVKPGDKNEKGETAADAHLTDPDVDDAASCSERSQESPLQQLGQHNQGEKERQLQRQNRSEHLDAHHRARDHNIIHDSGWPSQEGQ